MKTILLITSLLISTSVYSVTPVQEGQKAPETGYIFNKDEEKQVRGINEKRLKLEDLSVKQDEFNKTQFERIDALEKELEKRTLSKTEKVLLFVGGMFTTGMLVYITNKLKD